MNERKPPTKVHAVRGRRGYFILRASRRNPATGDIEYAKDHGKRAFKIWISLENRERKPGSK
jgi:hypothetical protein